jgi:hypothetical protein
VKSVGQLVEVATWFSDFVDIVSNSSFFWIISGGKAGYALGGTALFLYLIQPLILS